MFETIGLLCRFPFFVLGITLLSISIIPFWGLVFILHVIGLPFVYMGSAFKNDKSGWEHKVKDFNEVCSSEFFAKPYRVCYNWFIKKDHRG